MNIAGHHFPEDEWVKKCSRCGRRLLDILSTQESDIGQQDIACYGLLNRSEYMSIVEYREAVWATIAGHDTHAEPSTSD